MKSIAEQIKQGMVLAFFASAYADQADECGEPLTGEIMDQLPADIDPAALHAADTLISDMLLKNGVSDLERFYTQLIERCCQEGADVELTPENFGHYCAMQAMGHGVGLERFGYQMRDIITVPYVEFGSYALEKDYFNDDCEE